MDYQGLNQEFFRPGGFSWNYGSSLNNYNTRKKGTVGYFFPFLKKVHGRSPPLQPSSPFSYAPDLSVVKWMQSTLTKVFLDIVLLETFYNCRHLSDYFVATLNIFLWVFKKVQNYVICENKD